MLANNDQQKCRMWCHKFHGELTMMLMTDLKSRWYAGTGNAVQGMCEVMLLYIYMILVLEPRATTVATTSTTYSIASSDGGTRKRSERRCRLPTGILAHSIAQCLYGAIAIAMHTTYAHSTPGSSSSHKPTQNFALCVGVGDFSLV